MNARPCKITSCDGDGNERLPMFQRTIRVPASLWRAVRRKSARDGKAIRWVVDDALDAELIPLIDQLRDLGLRGEIADDKLVRLPMDDNVRGRVLFGRRQPQAEPDAEGPYAKAMADVKKQAQDDATYTVSDHRIIWMQMKMW